jgi:hypothetical protein
MGCRSCASSKQSEYAAEVNIHFPGLKGMDKPAVWAFPKLKVCLDCGYTEFTIPENQLLQLGKGAKA